MASHVHSAVRVATAGAAAPGVPPAPRWGAVAREQFRAVGGALRGEMWAAAAVLAAMTVPLLIHHARNPARGSDLQFTEMALMVAMAGVLAPMAVWKGDGPARRSYLWALPVGRAPNTLVKVAAGWGWLMVFVAAFLLWAAVLARVTGGELSLGDTRFPLRELPDGVAATPADFFRHRWPVPAWLWIVPFTAATAAYLLGSVAALLSEHPWRWIAGFIVGWLLLAVLGHAWGHAITEAVRVGRYGLEVLVTGSDCLTTIVATPTGGQVRTGVFVPDPARWAQATALWIALGLAMTLAAARRHQER